MIHRAFLRVWRKQEPFYRYTAKTISEEYICHFHCRTSKSINGDSPSVKVVFFALLERDRDHRIAQEMERTRRRGIDCLITEETTAMGFVIFGKGSNLKCIWADYMAHSDTFNFLYFVFLR